MTRTPNREAPSKSRKATPVSSPRMRGSAASGVNTRELVLRTAREVLVSEGYANFSIRRVADAAGITVGNLTYHFPGKHDLVRALIALLISEYAAAQEQLYRDVSAQPERRLERLVEWLMHDAASAKTHRLFRELWAMALRDPAVARVVDDFYDGGMDMVARVVRDIYPTLDSNDARELAHMIALISEGATVIYGTRADRKVSLARLAQVAAETIVQAVQARLSASKSRSRRVSLA